MFLLVRRRRRCTLCFGWGRNAVSLSEWLRRLGTRNALHGIQSSSIKALAAGFMLGVGEALAGFGRPEATTVLEHAERTARSTGRTQLVSGSLQAQERFFKSTGDTLRLGQVRKRLVQVNAHLLVGPHV